MFSTRFASGNVTEFCWMQKVAKLIQSGDIGRPADILSQNCQKRAITPELQASPQIEILIFVCWKLNQKSQVSYVVAKVEPFTPKSNSNLILFWWRAVKVEKGQYKGKPAGNENSCQKIKCELENFNFQKLLFLSKVLLLSLSCKMYNLSHILKAGRRPDSAKYLEFSSNKWAVIIKFKFKIVYLTLKHKQNSLDFNDLRNWKAGPPNLLLNLWHFVHKKRCI